MTGDPPTDVAEFLERAVARRGAIAVAAIEDFEVAWTAGAGGADDDTLFQGGSLSKTVTSAVALELVERGALDLDEPVAERLRSWHFPTGAGGTTLRDLLGHTAGANVPFYPGYPQGGAVPTLAQSLTAVEPATTPAVDIDPAAVGSFRYSGGGYSAVQQLIEDATGAPFAETARELVLDRLGMSRSTFAQPPPEPLRASLARDDWHTYPECAAAGLWTTAGDLARFVRAVQAAAAGRPALLPRQTAEAMLDPRAALPPGGQWRVLALFGVQPPRSAGLGLFVRGHRFINLGGAARSFSALTGSTDTGAGAVVMSAGCRTPVVFRTLLQLGDSRGWSDFRTSPRRLRAVRRKTSDLLVRILS